MIRSLDIYTQVPFYADIDGDGVGSMNTSGTFVRHTLSAVRSMGTVMMKMPLCIRQIERYDEVDQNLTETSVAQRQRYRVWVFSCLQWHSVWS